MSLGVNMEEVGFEASRSEATGGRAAAAAAAAVVPDCLLEWPT